MANGVAAQSFLVLYNKKNITFLFWGIGLAIFFEFGILFV
jgi:hypothetical protein